MIYTLGYNAWSREGIAEKIAELDAWLVDVRFSARSARAGFDEADLRAFFPSYVRVRELGNKAFREGRIELLDPPRGIARIAELVAERPVLLICACRNIESCHRRVAGRGGRLGSWPSGDAPRASSPAAAAPNLPVVTSAPKGAGWAPSRFRGIFADPY